MRRPLQELPLYQFLPAVQDDMHGRNNKRPLSPGGTAIISPVKRRNLAGQDMFSPERTLKSPRPSSLKSIASGSKFSDLLTGPHSPARILDFGLPKHLAGDPEKRPVSVDDDVDLTPTRRHPSSSRLAPSPELKPRDTRTRGTETNDVFSNPPVCRLGASSRCSYTLIPRELPPAPDSHSVHYPGFVVHQDSHIFAFESSTSEDEREVEDDEESWKENSPVYVSNNLPTPRSSSFSKAFLDGDKNLPSPKFRPGGSVRTPRTDVAGPSSVAFFRKNMEKSLETKKNSRRIMLDELDSEEDCVTEE